MARELVRKVQADCVIEIDSNAYSVPWRLISETVRVGIAGGMLRVSHTGHEVAVHHRRNGRFERVVDPPHFDGIVSSAAKTHTVMAPFPYPIRPPELIPPLLEYH